jgi:CubicO group peptidase (beta-lactamase class C family)
MILSDYLFRKMVLLMLLMTTATAGIAQEKINLKSLIDGLDSIRVELKIPGMVAALKQGDSILFEKGFGYADLEHHIRATPNTTFRIASITKTFTSTLVMQLVEQGKLNLQTPISFYGLDLGNPNITVGNLLTHTSEGEPGTYFQYNGFRYGQLGPIIEKASGKPFYQLLMENIVMPLNMSSTAPGFAPDSFFRNIPLRKEMLPYFETSFSHLAKPYMLNEKGEIVETVYLNEFGAFGGLATTVGDLLKYSAAIGRNQFVRDSTQREIFTPNHTKRGVVTPYGLGWFVQTDMGIDYYWHYGQTQGESGLLVKVPSEKLTLVVLANTDKLSQPFPLGDGDIFTSPVAQLLYKYYISLNSGFVAVDYTLPIGMIRKKIKADKQSPYKDFYNKELVTQAAMFLIRGDTLKAMQFYDLYARLNFTHINRSPEGKEIAGIRNVGINQEVKKSFKLMHTTQIRVYGVGENCSGDFSSWCDYGWIEGSSGKLIWQMPGQKAERAGGALKNQRVEAIVELPAGSYILRYKSDAGHAFNNWDSAPPDNFFWGIVLFAVTHK